MAAMAVTTPLTIESTDDYFQRHQSQSILSDRPKTDILPPYTSETLVPGSASGKLPWRPFYLRRIVLFGFIVVFILIIIAIEILFEVSNRNSGIATGSYAEHYLWTYGPTAFLTVIAAFWARTEYQSKLVAPWIRLSQPNIPISRSLLLDYVSQFSPIAIFTSLRQRDFTVSISVTISLIIKLLVVISTGLLSLAPTLVTEPFYPITIQDAFFNNNTKLANKDNRAWYIMRGQSIQNLTLPGGISDEYAFQTVETNLPDIAGTRVTVDGLANLLDCEAIQVRFAGASYPITDRDLGTSILNSRDDDSTASDLYQGPGELNLTLISPSCNAALVTLRGVWLPDDGGTTALFARFQQIQCDDVTGDAGKRVLVMFGNLTYDSTYSEAYGSSLPSGTLDYSTQLLCVPKYSITSVDVVHNGTEMISVQPVQGASNRTLDSVTAWDIMEGQFQATNVEFMDQAWADLTVNISSVIVDVDLPMQLVLNSAQPGLKAMTLMEPEVLQQVITDYYRRIGAIVTKISLMEPASANTTGFATVTKNRLIVSSWASQWMVALLAICVFLTAMAFFFVPTQGFLPYNPNSLFNLMLISLHSHQLLKQLRYVGAANENQLARFLGSSRFQSGLFNNPDSDTDQFYILNTTNAGHEKDNRPPQTNSTNARPTILHPICLLTLGLAVSGLVIALEALLLKSNRENGLGDITDNEAYIHYAWTAVPSLVFGLLAMAFSAVDFEVRSLAPYMALTRSVSGDAFARLEFLDMTIPEAMYKEIKLRKPWTLTTTTAFLIASLFTTFSASLFQESSIPITTDLKLRVTRSFSPSFDNWFPSDLRSESTRGTDTAQIASLILTSNYSFPRFTYDDLAFPELTPGTNLSYDSVLDSSSAVSISAVVPAVRASMDCRSYDSTQIFTNLTLGDDEYYGHNPLEIKINMEDCSHFGDIWTVSTSSDATYFAAASEFSDGFSAVGACSESLYIWGKMDYNATPMVQHVAALGCNTTFEGVDVNTTFTGSDLNIDTGRPPQPLENTARNASIGLGTDFRIDFDIVADNMVNVVMDPQILDTFFGILVTSPWAIPLSTLGDPSAAAEVAAAIQFQHRVILAQMMAEQRAPADATNTTLGEAPGDDDKDAHPAYAARATTTTATAGRRRVVQDPASTHVLVALLAAAAALVALGWVAGPRADVLPRRPTTVASALALLAGGNVPARLSSFSSSVVSGEEATLAATASAAAAAALGGSGARLWMGWGVLPDEEGQESGCENEGGVSQFGIFVVDEDDIPAARMQWEAARGGYSHTQLI